MAQFETCMEFINHKTEKAGESDLILFIGDMNVNGDAKNPEAKSYTEMVKDNVSLRGAS